MRFVWANSRHVTLKIADVRKRDEPELHSAMEVQ